MRAVLSNRPYRTMWLSTLGSMVGSWMQTVILAAFVYDTTKDTVLTSLVAFCGLIPQLLFSTVGGVIADLFDRKRIIVWVSIEQLVGSLVIAWIVHSPDFSRVTLLLAVAVVGTGAALEGPVMLAAIPSLVRPDQISGAVALASVSLNVSRVIGPAIGAVLYVEVGASWVFVFNAATYLLVVLGVSSIHLPPFERRHGESWSDRILGGYRHVRRNESAWRAMVTIFFFGLMCSAFVPLMPVIASVDFDIAAKSTTYGLLYATFGCGAVVGSLATSTFFAHIDVARVPRYSLIAFAVVLSVYVSLSTLWAAFPVAFVLGICHFTTVTSVTTVFQSQLDHAIRGRASGIWQLALIGTVPLSALMGGWLVTLSTINTVMYGCAASAFVLSFFADLRTRSVRLAA